jgi:hypothetical protein
MVFPGYMKGGVAGCSCDFCSRSGSAVLELRSTVAVADSPNLLLERESKKEGVRGVVYYYKKGGMYKG